MTKREAAIVSAHTKFLIGDVTEMQKYISEKAGYDVFDINLSLESDKHREAILADFVNIIIEDWE